MILGQKHDATSKHTTAPLHPSHKTCQLPLHFLLCVSQGLAAAEEERFESRNLDDSDTHSEATGTTEEDLRPVKVQTM